MPDAAYRLFFENTPATRDQLDQVQEITVEQQIDMAWEARFVIPICTDENGKWSSEKDPHLAEFHRIRLEVRVGDGKFVALIDGPVVGTDRQMSSEPGQSN